MDTKVLMTQQWLNETYAGTSGYSAVDEDGITGMGTIRALIWALQTELGISADGVFGDGTAKAFTALSTESDSSITTINHQIHILQGIVDPLCRQHRHLFTQTQIQFPAVRRWRYVDTFLIKSVNDRLHGNVAGQIPVIFSPFPSGVQMTEQAVEHHMEKCPVDMDSATLIHGKYPLRAIIDHKPIRSHG